MTELKKTKLTISGNKPLQIDENIPEDMVLNISEEQGKIIHQVGETVKAYLDSVKELLSGKYAHLTNLVPIHLSDPGYILVAIGEDSVVLRFEKKQDEAGILAGWFPNDLSSIATLLSQGVVHCYPNKDFVSEVPKKGIELQLLAGDTATKVEKNIATLKIGFDVVIQQPKELPKPPNKPYCLFSVNNFLDIVLEGVFAESKANSHEGQRFLIRNTMRLPVGWECIEIYPFFEVEQWKPEFAPLWAERDLLAAVVASQFHETRFQSLDPKASAREQYATLLKSFKDLLDSNPDREEALQIFLQDSPALLCPTYTRMWPKLPLGAQKTDFVFQEATSDYMLVEIERSTHQLFNKDGHTSQPLNHAHGQVIDWKRYLEDNLATVQRELGLTGISANPKSLVVIGRSKDLTPDNRRKLTVIENESPKLKIMTYDDVYENAKSVIENLLGPIWEVQGNTRIYYPS